MNGTGRNQDHPSHTCRPRRFQEFYGANKVSLHVFFEIPFRTSEADARSGEGRMDKDIGISDQALGCGGITEFTWNPLDGRVLLVRKVDRFKRSR